MFEDKDPIRNDDDDISVPDVVGTTAGVIAGAAGVSLLGPLGTVAGAITGSVIGNTAGAAVEYLADGVDPDRKE